MAGLEKIIATGAVYDDISQIAREFYKKPADYKLIEKYALRYLANGDENSAKLHAEALKKNAPALVQENMDASRKFTEGNLAKTVEDNYEAILNGPENFLLETAFALEGISREERTIKEHLKEGNIDGVKKLYIELYGKNPAVKHFAEKIADEKFFLGYYPKALNDKKNEFMQKYLKNITEDKAELDFGKIKSYVSDKIAKMKPEDKTKAYIEIGVSLYDYTRQIEEQQKKLEAEKAKKKK